MKNDTCSRPMAHASRDSSRSGFTLVELLIVMMIIAILAAMTYGALFQAQATAREARTKALIAKLHGQMMTRWESYRTRRVPVSTVGMTPPQAAQMRLWALRDLMRMEIPNIYFDITSDPVIPGLPQPALLRAYRRKLLATPTYTLQWEGAECLYLVLTTAAGEEGLSAYELTNTEVGDVDGDGMREFLDGWGKPISFIRWPTGFVSDLQPVSTTGLARAPAAFWAGTAVPGVTPDYKDHHDPLDPRKVDQYAFALIPLIYSRGPDGIQDLYQHSSTPPLNQINNPYWSMASPPGIGLGQMGDYDSPANGDVESFDNIHNHMIGTRQ